MLWLWLGLCARAGEEITVYGDGVKEAYEAVVEEIRDLGYVRLLRLGQRTYFLPKKLWKPRIMLHEQGFLRVRRTPVLPLGASSSKAGHEDEAFPGLITGGEALEKEEIPPAATVLLQGRRKLNRQVKKVVDSVEPALADYREALQRRGLALRLQALDGELDRIWVEGQSADGSSLGPKQRQDALLELWLQTSDTAAGAEIRARIEIYLRHRVQTSDHPILRYQIDAVNGQHDFPELLEP